MKYKITLRRIIHMLSMNIYIMLCTGAHCAYSQIFLHDPVSRRTGEISRRNHELRSRTVFMTLARRWQFIITSHTGIACNLRHVLQFTGLLSVSFALIFSISLSRELSETPSVPTSHARRRNMGSLAYKRKPFNYAFIWCMA